MNEEELRAEQWLESQGYSDILDLSKDNLDPPDFEVENSIAVEVRRLNRESDLNKGLESVEFNLARMIKEVLEKAGETPNGYTVYVTCETQGISLETRNDRKNAKELVAQLVEQYTEQINNALKSNEHPIPWKTGWERGMQLRFFTGLFSNTAKFRLNAVQADVASASIVVRELIDNINHCIEKKTCKVQSKIDLYDEWWLVLIDWELMMPPNLDRLDRNERKQVQNGLVVTEPWSRIIVIGWNEIWEDFSSLLSN